MTCEEFNNMCRGRVAEMLPSEVVAAVRHMRECHECMCKCQESYVSQSQEDRTKNKQIANAVVKKVIVARATDEEI